MIKIAIRRPHELSIIYSTIISYFVVKYKDNTLTLTIPNIGNDLFQVPVNVDILHIKTPMLIDSFSFKDIDYESCNQSSIILKSYTYPAAIWHDHSIFNSSFMLFQRTNAHMIDVFDKSLNITGDYRISMPDVYIGVDKSSIINGYTRIYVPAYYRTTATWSTKEGF